MRQESHVEQISGAAGPVRAFGEFSVKQTAYAPGTVLKRHFHEAPIFSFAMAGGTAVSCGRSTEWCEEGSLLYLAAGDEHANAYPERSVRLHVQVSNRFWRHCSAGVKSGSGPIRHQSAAAVGRSIVSAFQTGDNLAEFTILGSLMDLIGLFRAADESPGTADPGPWLLRVRDYLETHCPDKLDMHRLAELAGRHPVHVSRAFRRHFGRSMSDFVRERRLIRAAGLLRAGELPLPEIALECGYYDQSHFTRAFSSFMAASPRRYRQDRAISTE
jgi:AraC family transcriptional regulator